MTDEPFPGYDAAVTAGLPPDALTPPTNNPWAELISESLVYRILDDARYCERRLGYVPTEAQVRLVINERIEKIADAMAEHLDPYEADIWYALDERERSET